MTRHILIVCIIFFAACTSAAALTWEPLKLPEPPMTDVLKVAKCSLKPDPGPCKANMERYFYDDRANKCMVFLWGGCQGTVPFGTMKECEDTCGSLGGPSRTGKPANTNNAYVNRLRTTKSCRGCNLQEADLAVEDLSGASLNGADLRWADLSITDLSKADLRSADLREANLAGANLRGADLDRAQLDGANLSGATWTNGRVCRNPSIGACK